MWERRGAASAKRAREGLLLRDRAGGLGAAVARTLGSGGAASKSLPA